MEPIKLKPCPFCGKEAKARLVCSNSDAGTDVRILIKCDNCNANIQEPIFRYHIPRDNSTDFDNVMHAFWKASMNWNSHYKEQSPLERYRERIERQINETVCKRDVLNLCPTKEEKARADGFVDGLGWLLEIMDDVETAVNDDEEGG